MGDVERTHQWACTRCEYVLLPQKGGEGGGAGGEGGGAGYARTPECNWARPLRNAPNVSLVGQKTQAESGNVQQCSVCAAQTYNGHARAPAVDEADHGLVRGVLHHLDGAANAEASLALVVVHSDFQLHTGKDGGVSIDVLRREELRVGRRWNQ